MTEPHRPLYAVVLAAGEGSRMKSERPKPLHRLCGKPMLAYVLESLADVPRRPGRHRGGPQGRAGHQEDRRGERGRSARVRRAGRAARHRRRGARSASPGLPDDLDDDGDVIVLPGDTPLLTAGHHRPSRRAAPQHRRRRAPCSPPILDDPTGYGRVVRGKDDRVVAHRRARRRHRRASSEIDEVNTSIYCFKRSLLAPALRRLNPDNAQGEYYLTDVVAVLADGRPRASTAVVARRRRRGLGRQRPPPARARRGRDAPPHQRGAGCAPGVTMVDPASTFVDTTVVVGRDVTLFPGAMLQGATVIGDGAEIGPNTRLVDCTVGAGRRRRGDDRPAARDRRRGPRRSLRRVSRPAPRSPPGTPPDRSTLRPPHAGLNGKTAHGAHHQEAAAPRGGSQQPPAGRGGGRAPGRRARATSNLVRVRQRRDPLPLRRVDPRRRRLHHPEPLLHAPRCRSTTRSWSS